MELVTEAVPEEPFPYPVNITREDFADVSLFDPDEFLFKNHRYTSLDSLLSDLRSLSKSLNQDLLDLVNNEYTNFIKLGQSIGSCVELIDNLSVEARNFKTTVSQTLCDFSASSNTSAVVLHHKRSLNLLKNKIKLILLLHEQCVSFETLAALNVADLTPSGLEQKLHTLTTLHLSIGKMFALLVESASKLQRQDNSGSNVISENGTTHDGSAPEENTKPLPDARSMTSASTQSLAHVEICLFFDNVVRTKVLALKIEFKLYLDELLTMAKAQPHTYKDLILSILHTYRVLGMSSEALQILGNKS